MRWHMELEQFYCIECIDSSEKPISFVSPSKTKRKYPQIEKEGLSCVLGVKKLLQFTMFDVTYVCGYSGGGSTVK